jgi:hypothetical protein
VSEREVVAVTEKLHTTFDGFPVFCCGDEAEELYDVQLILNMNENLELHNYPWPAQ